MDTVPDSRDEMDVEEDRQAATETAAVTSKVLRGGGGAAAAAASTTAAVSAAATAGSAAVSGQSRFGSTRPTINTSISATTADATHQQLSPVRSTGSTSSTSSVPMGSFNSELHLKKCPSKLKRVEEFHKMSWPQPPEEVAEAELSGLRSIWEPYVSPDLALLLFPVNKFGPPNQDAIVPVLNELSLIIDGPISQWGEHSDLLLRYFCYCLCLRETSSGMMKVLELVIKLFNRMRAENVMLHEAEANSVLPHIIDKSGHKSERHRLAFKLSIQAAGEIISPQRINQHLLHALGSKNKKSRVVSIEEIIRVVEQAGAASLGRTGVREIGACITVFKLFVHFNNTILFLLLQRILIVFFSVLDRLSFCSFYSDCLPICYIFFFFRCADYLSYMSSLFRCLLRLEGQ